MEFGRACRSISEQDCCDPFPFPPTTTSILFPQACDLANTTVDRYRLDLGDVADDIKVHTPSTPRTSPAGTRLGVAASLYHICVRGSEGALGCEATAICDRELDIRRRRALMVPSNEIRIHGARRRDILRVELGRSAPATMIVGMSAGGGRDGPAQPLVDGGWPSQRAARTPRVAAGRRPARRQQHATAIGAAP